MRYRSRLSRILLTILAISLILGCVFLHPASLEAAQSWPGLAYLRLPVYIVIVMGPLPIAVVLRLAWSLASISTQGRGTITTPFGCCAT